MQVWQMAGLCSNSVKMATVVSWMTLGVYFTRVLLFKMRKAKSQNCLGCGNIESESLTHILLHCTNYKEIREAFIPQYLNENNFLSDIFDNEDQLILSILDPLSSKLPDIVTTNWESPKLAYRMSRIFCYNIHKKREKIDIDLDKPS